MSGCGCEDVACSAQATAERRRVLWLVLAINLVIFVGEFGAGLWADSTALQADSLDSLGDALVYLLSLVVLARSVRARAGAALVKGGIQALFGIGVLIEVGLKVLHGAEPLAPVMGIAAGAALVANTTCFALLYRHRGEDINMRSVWLCSRNDVIGNAGVLITAGVVALTGFAWPDWVFGALMALLFLSTSLTVVRAAWQQFRAPAVASLRRDAIV
jgi:Co/Zn/Cd efflux system component